MRGDAESGACHVVAQWLVQCHLLRRPLHVQQAELNGSQLEDYTLSIGWGKPVKITSTPFVLPPSVAAGGATLGQSTAAFFAQFNKPPPAPRGLPVAPVPALPPAPIPALPADYPPASAVPPAAGAKGSSTGGRWDATQGTAEVGAPPSCVLYGVM